jgi:hypothetical protein
VSLYFAFIASDQFVAGSALCGSSRPSRTRRQRTGSLQSSLL